MKTTLCLAVFIVGWGSTVLGVPILDQSQTSLGSGEFVQGTISVAQTFAPSLNGSLSSLNLVLNNNNDAEGKPLFVSIYNTQGGVPGTALGTKSRTIISAGIFATYSFDFSDLNIVLNANTEYAIVLSAPATASGYYVRGSVGDTYTGGLTLTQASAGAPWQTDTRERDFAFQTSMNVPDATDFSIVAMAGISLISFGYFRNRSRTQIQQN
jgi:hypothetical protein